MLSTAQTAAGLHVRALPRAGSAVATATATGDRVIVGAGDPLHGIRTPPSSKLSRRRVTAGGEVDFGQGFFGREVFLMVSGKLSTEAYCLALPEVYSFGPIFHPENSNTSRHLAEFWMIEPKIAFADLIDNAALAEATLK